MRTLWPIRLTLLANIGLFAVAFQQWFAVGCLLFVLFLSLLPLRVEVDSIGQLIFGLAGLGGAYVLTVVIGPAPKHPLSEAFALAQAFACVWMLLIVEMRLFLSNPWGGQKISALIALVGLFACGGNQLGYVYHGFASIFALLALWTVAQDDVARPSWSQTTPKRKFLLTLAVLGTVMTAGILFQLLPYLEQIVTKRLQWAMQNRMQSGFDSYFQLGSLSQMLQSRRIVLRVRGEYRSSMHLRGLVYQRYTRKHWRVPSKSKIRRQVVPHSLPASPERWAVEYVSGDVNYYFVPLLAAHFAATHELIRVDRWGLISPLSDQTPDTISFSLKKGTQIRTIAPPQRWDLDVPPHLRMPLYTLASNWTSSSHTAEQKLHTLIRKLRTDYQYSLSFQRPKEQDPVLNFLLQNKQGHCEYFATALALLARSLGIPTRVVGGYLATEYNGLGGYYIVREQNAHAWVEVWLPKRGWQTADATPPSGLLDHMPTQTSWWGGVIDGLRVASGRFRNWITNLTMHQMLLLIGVIVLFWVCVRLFRWWRERYRSATAISQLAYQQPLPAFDALLAVLQSVSPKKQSESLEQYAVRLCQQDTSESTQQASSLILDYASLRYGRVGNPEALTQQIQAWLAKFV